MIHAINAFMTIVSMLLTSFYFFGNPSPFNFTSTWFGVFTAIQGRKKEKPPILKELVVY